VTRPGPVGLIAVLVLACGAVPADAAIWAGSTAAAGLDLPAGALAAVGGGAAAGLVDDAAAVLVNPARLGAAGPASIGATWIAWPGGVSDSQLAGAMRLAGFGTGGLHLRVTSVDVPATIENGDGTFGSQQGSIPYRVLAGTVGFAPDLSGLTAGMAYPLAAGGAVQVVHRELDSHAVTGFGGTAGVTLGVAAGVTVHLLARDLGTTDGVAWPMTFAAGGTFVLADAWLMGDRLAAGGSAEWSKDTGAGGSALIEYGLGWNGMLAALRVGEKLTLAREASVLPSAGLVLRVSRVSLEMGVVPFGPFGSAQIVTLGYSQEPPAGLH